jgi:hypothetical protein
MPWKFLDFDQLHTDVSKLTFVENRHLKVMVSGTQKVIALDTKESKSEVAFTFIVIRLGRKYLRFQ